MAKTTKSSTVASRKTKRSYQHHHSITDLMAAEEGLCFYQRLPMTEYVTCKLANELIEYAKKEEQSLTIGQFCKLKDIHRDTFDLWCSKYPKLASAKRIALQYIGNNRELGSLKKQLDSKTVMHIQYQYDDAWKKADHDQANLKKLEDSAGEKVKYIVVQDAEKTDLVTPKDKK